FFRLDFNMPDFVDGILYIDKYRGGRENKDTNTDVKSDAVSTLQRYFFNGVIQHIGDVRPKQLIKLHHNLIARTRWGIHLAAIKKPSAQINIKIKGPMENTV